MLTNFQKKKIKKINKDTCKYDQSITRIIAELHIQKSYQLFLTRGYWEVSSKASQTWYLDRM